MRLLSGANLAKEDEDKSQTAIREWSGLTAGAELDGVLKGLRSPETRQEMAPPDLKAELRPYQQTGYAWLRFVVRLGLGGCLADDMGLGKTVQVISLLLDLKRDKQKKASLLVVPASLIANWKSELAKFAPSLSFAVAHPSEVNANAGEIGLADADTFDLIITTYGMLVRNGLDEAVSLATGDPRRSPGDQELRHEADPGREGIDRRQSDRHDRHARRESAFGPLVALRFLEPRAAGHRPSNSARSSSGCKTPRSLRSNRCEISCDPTSSGG